MHNKFYVTLINKHLNLWAVNSPDNRILLRTLDKHLAVYVTFVLNNEQDITTLVQAHINGTPVENSVVKSLKTHYESLNSQSKPF